MSCGMTGTFFVWDLYYDVLFIDFTFRVNIQQKTPKTKINASPRTAMRGLPEFSNILN